ncbi:MAG TPA: penicillin-binding transpeptidase domain-containing protein [Kofleriaceae bacterium]|nr:penicillin-binding transpeptidase domain-containing protein [Kofleriaceae bacterium]
MTRDKKLKPMTPGVSSSARVRAYLAGAVVSLGLFGVAMKAWALQVDDGAKYREAAARQHAMRLDIPAPRGEVSDRMGRPLAITADADSVWANPREVHDVAGTAEKLAALLHGDAGVLESRLAGDRGFVWLDRHVTTDIAKAVRDAKLHGVYVAREPRRWYPGKTVGGTVIGRADIDGNGLDGIELSMNELLAGKHGKVTALRDARGHRMLADGVEETEATPGAAVKLSLDRSIQAIADDALYEAVTTHKAKSGVAVVLEVDTGRVLALSSFPMYDPNTGHIPQGARNKPVTDSFEAGSVMKVFSVATALEAGVVKPETSFAIGSAFKVGPKSITDVHSYPSLTVAGIIKHSSNIGAAKIALRLGSQKLYEGYKRFGFGAKTDIELPGEQVGMLRRGETWREVELATMSYGYGLTVTPLQITAALAAIGNHGIYHPPRIVDQVVDTDGTVLYRGAGEARRVLSQKVADDMLPILASVFDKGPEGGTAKTFDVQGFDCGGKTGTAYKYDPSTRHYASDRYLASFAGLAPIANPRLAIVVQIDEPSAGEHYGGTVAGPAFAKIASESLRYLGVPGAPLIPTDKWGRPLVMVDDAGRPLRDAKGSYIPKPETVKKPAPPPPAAKPEPMTAPQDVEALVQTLPETPDFRGMGVSRALDEARKLHLDVEMTGTGQVVEQELMGAGKIKLTFSDDARRISAP